MTIPAALVAGLFQFAVPVVAASAAVGETGSVHPEGGTSPQQGRVPCPDDLQVLVERPYAARAGIETGSTIRLRAAPEAEPCPALVAGLFEPRADPSKLMGTRPRVLFHLPQLQALAGREGEVDYFTVRLRPDVDAAAAARDMEPLLVGTQVWRAADVAERASTTFRVVRRFHAAIAGITLVAGGVFLACIMVLKVQERRAAVAAARLAGIPRRILMGWTVAEAALLSALGGVAGLGVGLAASAAVNVYYQRAYDTTLVFSIVTGEMLAQGFALAVVLGLGAGVVAGARLFATDPLEQLGR
ncbi:MAG: FtsX-like permease family protein [Gemmatimonadetes bacterium]|nr:FtsX-like permease family protein [Gemmatimonadota bacterium]MYH53914.1 FtsX-like permease family protein [Gemmatimonadota bacterium]MYK67031.1 FtsX-like permease family protein [Gemmatimonadota bacterium]